MTLNVIADTVRATSSYRQLASRPLTAPGQTAITGVAGSLRAFILQLLHEERGRQLVVLTPGTESAEQLRDDLAVLGDPNSVHLLTGQAVADAQTLRILSQRTAHIILAGPPGLLAPLPSPSTVNERTFSIDAGKDEPMNILIGKLENNGFTRTEFVGERGEYAVRGGIIDVFPFVGENPVRLEFVGDTVNSIREFEPISQRSIRELSSAVVVPDLLGANLEGGSDVVRTSSLLDFCDPDAILVVFDPDLVWAAVDQANDPSRNAAQFRELLDFYAQVHFLSLAGKPVLDFSSAEQPSFNGSVKMFYADLLQLQAKGTSVWITCDGQAELARLKDLLNSFAATAEELLDLARITFSLEALHGGFVLRDAGLALYTEHQMFGRLRRRGRRRSPRFKGFSEREFKLVRKGDYVVHQDFGIGIFDGLKRIHVRDVEQEVASVQYAEKDRLYVNLNYINKLQKYSSQEGHIPRLTRLGSPDWDRLKARAKGRVKDIARQLIALYAKRRHMEGFSFQPDTPWQKELEASFMYEDTFDQAKATLETKQDMELPHPMDRLICGDVGFGKTEVAIRAAFKAVMDGKQVAIMVPTTILAIQHFHTFQDRLGRYGATINVLSRLKNRKEQLEILAALKEKRLDIIIATHRLLSKDVGFKDLGLLVIDEEHRFGVAAKEKLRTLRSSVDTLTLTATPIPRTLHFSLMGARDLSIIATPPRNRLPIITEVVQWDDALIREAILREMHRGGQVYVVHDRIHDMDELTVRLQQLLPRVRIRTAHGQMRAHEIEEVMLDFLDRKVDVLVATKIIESGIDIPNVNTIVINKADRFGMAELYQLRGRVGRSNIQAYAYLVTPPVALMPKSTIRRLQAVQEFTELGSGFNLAMRDLEIRGAGNLLGAEQSGFIASMGFETYTRILEEAVQELKEAEFTELADQPAARGRGMDETLVEVDFDALIPDTYVRDDTERLALYRRFYTLVSEEQIAEVREELRDRFGPLPSEVENLLEAVRIRLDAAAIGFRKVHVGRTEVEIEFPPDTDTTFYESDRFQVIMRHVSGNKKGSLRQLGGTLKYSARLTRTLSAKETLESVRALMKELVG